MIDDIFSGQPTKLDDPYSYGVAVTPSDSVDLSDMTRGIYVGGAGAVSLLLGGGQTVILPAVPAGTMLRIRAKRINATGTTATNIVGLW